MENKYIVMKRFDKKMEEKIMFWDLAGAFIGSFVASFLIYNIVIILFNFIARYRVLPGRISVYSFIISIFVIAFILEAMNNWGNAFYYYFTLFVVFSFEYRKRMYQKCPHCAEKIKSDAVKCKHCHSFIAVDKVDEGVKK